MGRKKFNNLTLEKKDVIRKKILTNMHNLTKWIGNYNKELDIFDSVNDHILDLFECDAKCDTCDIGDDFKKCMYNFRVANIFLLKKIRHMEHLLEHDLGKIRDYLTQISSIFEEEKPIKQLNKESELDYYR